MHWKHAAENFARLGEAVVLHRLARHRTCARAHALNSGKSTCTIPVWEAGWWRGRWLTASLLSIVLQICSHSWVCAFTGAGSSKKQHRVQPKPTNAVQMLALPPDPRPEQLNFDISIAFMYVCIRGLQHTGYRFLLGFAFEKPSLVSSASFLP